MTITELPEVNDVAGSVTLHEHGLTIDAELPFNEWRKLGQQLLQTTDRALWSLGDWWIYGDRFAKEYHHALRQIEASSRLVLAGARVARAFPRDRRREQLSFEIHAVVVAEDDPDQERWLDEAERQGWNREQLAFAFSEVVERVPIAAIGVRATGELHGMLVREAERRDMDPKALGPLALERGLREMARDAIEEAA